MKTKRYLQKLVSAKIGRISYNLLYVIQPQINVDIVYLINFINFQITSFILIQFIKQFYSVKHWSTYILITCFINKFTVCLTNEDVRLEHLKLYTVYYCNFICTNYSKEKGRIVHIMNFQRRGITQPEILLLILL